jgi:hypothetical protein
VIVFGLGTSHSMHNIARTEATYCVQGRSIRNWGHGLASQLSVTVSSPYTLTKNPSILTLAKRSGSRELLLSPAQH